MAQGTANFELVENQVESGDGRCEELSLSTKQSEAIEYAVLHLGLEALKPKQREAIASYVSGNDTFVVLPTGYGKSVVYAALPMIFDKLRGTGVNTRSSSK